MNKRRQTGKVLIPTNVTTEWWLECLDDIRSFRHWRIDIR